MQSKEPFTDAGYQQVYFIDAPQIAAVTGLDLEEIYLQLDADQPGGLGVIPLPQLDAGPYLSYGLQWLAFGIMAPLGLGYFVWAELRERRKTKTNAGGSAMPPRSLRSPRATSSPIDTADFGNRA